ncbi:MAG: hypothetical protein Q4G13_02890 [Moraxella sp.]|nr:hypothetical protein [Moraxella sp.]
MTSSKHNPTDTHLASTDELPTRKVHYTHKDDHNDYILLRDYSADIDMDTAKLHLPTEAYDQYIGNWTLLLIVFSAVVFFMVLAVLFALISGSFVYALLFAVVVAIGSSFVRYLMRSIDMAANLSQKYSITEDGLYIFDGYLFFCTCKFISFADIYAIYAEPQPFYYKGAYLYTRVHIKVADTEMFKKHRRTVHATGHYTFISSPKLKDIHGDQEVPAYFESVAYLRRLMYNYHKKHNITGLPTVRFGSNNVGYF